MRLRDRIAASALACGLVLVTGGSAWAQESGTAAKVTTLSDLDEGQYPILLDGTLSGGGDLKEDNAPHSGHFRFPTALTGWQKSKERFREATGISFGGSYGVLYQNYSNPGLGIRDAIGQKLTLNFSRDIIGVGTANPVTLDVVLEGRGPIHYANPPLTAGILAGSITPTAATWGQFDFGVTQFYIRQNLANNKFQYTIGKIFAPNFVNAYPFFDDNRQFLNQSFATSPTIPSPLRGFGAVGVWYPGKNGFYVQGGIFTANSDDTGLTIDNFFKDKEFFYNLEIGYSALAQTGVPINARGPMDNNNVHLSFWYKDAQPNAAVIFQPSAKGVAFNANYMLGDNIMWFLRGGVSDGWITDRALSAGFGYRPGNNYSDLFGFGVGSTRPTNRNLREQVVAEVFYRYQVTPSFAITPDIQVIFNPSLNPGVDTLTTLGLRMRVTF